MVPKKSYANRDLARIVKEGNTSLLWFACFKLDELFHPAIKCIIESNPSSLLWETEYFLSCVHLISLGTSHCVLVPWIATNFQWVLDHEISHRFPPVFNSLNAYI